MKKAVAATSALLALLLGYAALDAADVVPGPLTTRPALPAPAAYPVPEVSRAPIPQILDDDVPAPAADVASIVTAVAGDDDMGESVSVTVMDAGTGAVVASAGETRPVAPASSLKVLTAAATLQALGPDARLVTTAMLSGSTLTLVGGGDVLLTTGQPDPSSIMQASLTDLAQQAAEILTAYGVSGVTVALDDSLFSERGYSPYWGSLDFPWVMPISPIAVDRGRVGPQVYVADPGLAAGEAFADELRAAGIAVSGAVSRGVPPDDAEQVGLVRSATIGEIVRYMLKVSENSVTEVMARLVAHERGLPTTFAGAQDAVEESLAELGLPTEGVTLYDTCGLASETTVTANLLAQTIALSLDNPVLESMVSSLPVAHLDGTLTDRASDAAGLVRAKTGTLVHVVSLTGVVQAHSGATYIFSVVAPEVERGAVGAARDRVDRFVSELVAVQ